MDGYGPASYGDGFADVYDEWYTDITDTGATVERLVEILGTVGGGAVLELGVGSGRLAVPLADRGIAVWGIDASEAMVDRLRAKPGGGSVRVVVGDMAALDLPDGAPKFAVAFAAYNTFFNLTSRQAQQRCLRRVAGCVVPGGRLVLEAFVPDDVAATPGGGVEARVVEVGRVVLSVSRRHPVEQVVDGQHIEITETGIRLRPWCVRWASPTELDEMAGGAGLALVERHAGWRQEPFTDASPSHVSVYERR